MKSEQELRAESEKIQHQINVIESKRRKEENQKFLGKFFKYRNSYGSGSLDWWLYLKVTNAGFWLKGFEFQLTSTGRFEAHREKCIMGMLQGYIEITKREYLNAWKIYLAKLKAGGK